MNWSLLGDALDRVVGGLVALLRVVTPRRVYSLSVLLVVLTGLGIGGYTVFENRQTLYRQSIGKMDGPNELHSLSKTTEQEIDSLTQRDLYVDMATIVTIDPYRNNRVVIYRSISDAAIRALVQKHDNQFGRLDASPLFSTNEALNRQMITLLNGEFKCYDAQDSGILDSYPELDKYLGTTCRVPIPPVYGRLVGYIALHSARKLNTYEQDKLRNLWMPFAMRLYLVDVQRQSASF